MKKHGLKTFALGKITEKHIRKRGTPKREDFENQLRLDLLDETFRQVRLESNMTQEDLGRMVGGQEHRFLRK